MSNDNLQEKMATNIQSKNGRQNRNMVDVLNTDIQASGSRDINKMHLEPMRDQRQKYLDTFDDINTKHARKNTEVLYTDPRANS